MKKRAKKNALTDPNSKLNRDIGTTTRQIKRAAKAVRAARNKGKKRGK